MPAMIDETCRPFPLDCVALLPGLFPDRFSLNRRYVMSLNDEALLQNHYAEAGMINRCLRATTHEETDTGDDLHWGWESPTCQIRGQFLGHWLSAAAKIYASTRDEQAKTKADHIISELGQCQKKNGGEWVASIPEKFLQWLPQGQSTWAPHYVVHKTLMGLYDTYAFAGNEQALEIMANFAKWFHRWTAQFSREQMDAILNVETGGMLEAWANLYGVTGKQEHLDLVNRYDRPRLFDPLLAGDDVLTNLHANTTIPEAHGAARAYEVTGDERWRKIVEAYWRCAVTDRGAYCTGGQTCGEIWTPPFEMAARLGDKNQEHCTVYNMIRLAEYLFRWTGDVGYADYIERNLYNGILAQQNPKTGMVAYFLPLEAGGRKIWSSPTCDFWCCSGTLVQAHTIHNSYVYYQDEDDLRVSQYIPSELRWKHNGTSVTVRQMIEKQTGDSTRIIGRSGAARRPNRLVIDISVACEKEMGFDLKLRLPWWLSGKAVVSVNDEKENVETGASSFHTISRSWKDDRVRLELPKTLQVCPLPDEPDTVAFVDGPIVLAGLCEEERTLHGDKSDPASMLTPDNEREWANWRGGYRVRGQERGLRFKPLHEVVDEPYTVYFPISSGSEPDTVAHGA